MEPPNGLTSGRGGLRLWSLENYQQDSLRDVVATVKQKFPDHDTYEMDAPDDRIELKTPWEVLNVDVSPNGKWGILTASSSRGIYVFDASNGDFVRDLDSDSVAGLAFSHDSQFLFCNGNVKGMKWRASDWELIRSEKRESNYPGAAAFSPDNKIIAVSKDRFRIELIDSENFETVAVLNNGKRLMPESIVFSPDGHRIAVSLRDRFEIWDIGKIQRKLKKRGLAWTQ